MNKDQKFGLSMASIVLGFFLILAASIMMYNHEKNQLIANSPDPLATKCAIGSDDMNESAMPCVILAGRYHVKMDIK